MNLEKAIIFSVSNGAYACNSDLTSQLVHMIFSTNESVWHLISYKSYKSKSVLQSPFDAELFAFANASDVAILLREDLRLSLGMQLEISLLMDLKSLFDTIANRSTTTEKRLMIDLKVTCEAFDTNAVAHLRHILLEYNIADAMTWIDNNQMML